MKGLAMGLFPFTVAMAARNSRPQPSEPAGGRGDHGLTLIEVLTVIAIVGLLIGLLMPAVQGAREAARRTQCGNHLKQISLAVTSYESNQGVLPPGGVSRGSCCSTKSEINWAVAILPYLEQQSVYELYDPQAFLEDPPNRLLRESPVAVYACPSDVDPLRVDVPEPSLATGVAYRRGSYRASTGLGDGREDSWVAPYRTGAQYPLPKNSRGAMYSVGHLPWGQVTVSEIRDGLSNTLLIGEHYTTTNPRRRTFWAYGFAAFNKSEVTPESRILINDYERCMTIGGSPWACKRMWGSGHPGLMQFAFCDGSVRALSITIDVNLLGRLATIAGGEINTLP